MNTDVLPELEALLVQNQKNAEAIQQLLDILLTQINKADPNQALEASIIQHENTKEKIILTIKEELATLLSTLNQIRDKEVEPEKDYGLVLQTTADNTAKISDVLTFLKEKPEKDDSEVLNALQSISDNLAGLSETLNKKEYSDAKVVKGIEGLSQDITDVKGAIESNVFSFDYTKIENLPRAIQSALDNLKIDITKHISPENAIAVKIYDSKGHIIDDFKPVVNVGGGGAGTTGGIGNGTIIDGVDSTIKATVFDYSNSNPVAVRLTDTNGDYVSSGAGASNLISPNETGNSTIIALTGNGVFTGTWEDVSSYQAVTIQTRSDQSSAANGLQVLFSPDATNADTPYVVTCSANQEKTIIRPVMNKYFKIIYTNGATPQGFLRLQVIYHTTAVQATMTDMLGDSREVLTPRLLTAADNRIYNGSTGFYDRQRSVVNMTDTPGTGVVSAGIMAQFDDVATTTVTENQYAPVRISSRRAWLVEGVSGGTAVATSLASVPSHDVTNAGTFAVQASITSAIPAGTNLLGKVSASDETDTIYQGTTARTPVTAFANVAASQTDSSIVTAQGASNKIRVLQVAAVAGGTATDLTFNSKGAGVGTAISCKFANGANGGEILPYSPIGWFDTSANEALTVTTGAGSTTGILIKYIVVT